jgi:hypothetical protein
LSPTGDLLGDVMHIPAGTLLRALATALAITLAAAAGAAEIGQIKVVKGKVSIERGGQVLPAEPGARVESADVVTTGADGSVGITLTDDTLLSAGPNSILALERYAFDSTTSQGEIDASLRKGSLAVISGRIAKQSPDAMKVRTPSSILGIRGTEFVVSVND